MKRQLAVRSLVHLLVTLLIVGETAALAFAPASPPAAAPQGQAGAPGTPASPAPAAPAEANTILIGDGGFSPASLTVIVGQEVIWINDGSVPYSVASALVSDGPYLIFLPVALKPPAPLSPVTDRGEAQPATFEPSASEVELAWRSGPLQPGQSFSRAFNEVGTFTYFNEQNPDLSGEIIVSPPNEAPAITIDTPLESSVLAVGDFTVSGSVSDSDGQVAAVLVNGVSAVVSAGAFAATIPLTSGNQTILAEATDDEGAIGLDTVVVLVDGDGPATEIVSPQNRGAVYTDQPFLDIYYDDFGDVVDTNSLQVTLTGHGAGSVDVLGDLTVTGDRAFGDISSALAHDSNYTLTVSVADSLGNLTQATAAFYVPADPGSLTAPVEGDQAGWVSGVVFDSSTCDPDLTECTGLAGARVTVERVDAEAVAQLRAQRQAQTMARLASAAPFEPLDPSLADNLTVAITGTAVTGPDGFFAFPLNETGIYWLRVEKNGFTYGQREIQVVRERSSTSNDIYLTPIDPAVTPCDSAGCSHTNSDASIKVGIPAGAIAGGQSIDVTATTFDNVEFLPSGQLPPGTWETYAFNLSGNSEITFTVPVSLQVKNTLGFSPGITVPLGYWNQNTLAWEHEGVGVVDETGEWISTAVSQFSNHDLNFPVALSDVEVDVGGDEFDPDNARDLPGDEEGEPCGDGAGGCFIDYKSGTLHEWIDTPPVAVLGQPLAQQLAYSSDRAVPSEVIDVRVSLKNTGSVQSLGYMGYELYIQGEKTATHYIPVNLTFTGELGRLRYLWDGRNAQGDLLPPGAYQYQVKLTFPYLAQYCRPYGGIFGNEPNCITGGTGVFVPAEKVIWKEGTVTLHGDPDSPFGIGWAVSGMQQLFETEAGDIVIVDGQRHDEFYFPQKDQLLAAEMALNGSANSSAYPVAAAEDTQEAPELDSVPERIAPAGPNDSPALPMILPAPVSAPYREETSPSVGTNQALANVCGAIGSNTTWTLASSPYLVTCDVSVQAGVTLTIEPGVIVQFQAGLSLAVSGNLLAQGLESSPITFEAAGVTAPASWKQIAFLAGSSGVLDHVIVQHGGVAADVTPQYGALTIASSDVSVSNSTLQGNGVAIYAGGGASPIISNNVFSNNTAYYGGAIYAQDQAALTIMDSEFSFNQAGRRGGAIYAIEAELDIRGSRFYSNTTTIGYGGALAVDWHAAADLFNNQFEDNKSNGGGGGAIFIYNELRQTTIISNTFLNNEAVNREGGAIYDESHQTIIKDNTFTGSKGRDGGAVYHQDYFYTDTSALIEGNVFRDGQARNGAALMLSYNGDPIVRNNLMVNNVAETSGGAIQIYGPAAVEHNVMYNNRAEFGGGMVNYSDDGLPRINNNIIVSNTATFSNTSGYLGGGGIYNGTRLILVSLGDHNLVWGNEGLDYQDTVPGPNDISANPLFVDPANGDFHLQVGSPAIDKGAPGRGNNHDFEGDQRPMGLAPDIGLDEFPAFGVAKESSTRIVAPGGALTYSVSLVNVENSPINAALTDTLPAGFSFSGYDSDGLSCAHDGALAGGTFTCSGDLAANSQQTIAIAVLADDSPSEPMLFSNVVTATADSVLAADRSDVWLSWCDVQVNDGPIGHDVQAAIDASSEGDVIKVSGRCFVPGGLGLANRTLQGGWNRDFSVRAPGLYPATLDAEYQGTVIYLTGAAILEGFTITGGSDTGVYAWGNPVVRNNIIEHNVGDAGGVNTGQAATIQNNVIRHNSGRDGGGIYVRTEDNNHLIDGNLIHDNFAAQDGGGIYIDWGGRVRNNMVYGNEAGDDGGGLYFDSRNRSPSIEHNTFYGNQAGVRGGGLALVSNFGWTLATRVRNNAVISNTAAQGGGIFLTSTMNGLDYNNVWGNGPDEYNAGTTPPANDLSADPLFRDPQAADFHLTAGSPMIDAADPFSDFYPDFEGDPRPMGQGGSDIGADEYPARTAFSRTETDYSRLEYDPPSNTYTRIYLDNTIVHFDAENRHDYTLDPDGTRTAYAYDGDGRLVSIAVTAPGKSAADWTWTLAYGNGKLASIIDPAGRVTSFTIDANNHLVAAQHPDGATQAFTYNQNGLMTQHQDENGQVTDFVYDDYGRISQIVDPAREVYDPDSRTASLRRVVRAFTPSDTGYPLLNDRPPGTPANPGPAVPRSVNLLDRIENGRGEISGRTDRWGFWASRTDGLGRTTRMIRGLDGRVLWTTYPDGDCAGFLYDENGNKLSETRMPAGQCTLPPADRDPNQVQTWSWTYEPRFNQVKTETDPNGQTTEYLYDYEVGAGFAGRVVQITHPEVDDGTGILVRPVEQFNYNSWGQIETEIDPRGTVTKYLYSQGTAQEASTGNNPLFKPDVTPVPGHLTQVIQDYGGENLIYTFKDFDAAGNPGFISSPAGQEATTYVYDAMNRLIQEVDALGMVSRFAYDGRGNLVEKVVDYTANGTTGRNVRTTYRYDAEDLLIQEATQADGLLVQLKYVYDVNGQLALERDGRGAETIYLYDLADQLTNVIDPQGYVITNTYGLDGNLVQTIDADGYVTEYEYDSFDRLVKETQDAGGLNLTTTYSYDLKGNILTYGDANGVLTCATYDALDRQISRTSDCGGLNLQTTFSYDLKGNQVAEVDHRGTRLTAAYDALNRLVLEVADDGGLNLETGYRYDAAGNGYETIDEQGVINRLSHNALNLVTSECADADGLNLCTTYTYDRLHNQASVTDPAGTTTQTVVNAFGLEIERVQDDGGQAAVTTFLYDNALNLSAIIDPNGNQTKFTSNLRGERTRTDYADGTTVEQAYDGRGNVVSHVLQDSSVITVSYDGAGRMIGRTYGISDNQVFDYDPVGRLTYAEQINGGQSNVASMAYNAIGDLITTTQSYAGDSWTVTYTHDYPAGEHRIGYPSGAERIYQNDPLYRLSRVEREGYVLVADYDYFDVPGYQTLTYGNSLVSRLDYDALGRITRISSPLADYRYGYDRAGNRLYQQRAHQLGSPADVYSYDGLYQLTNAWYGADATDSQTITTFDSEESFVLDDSGNRLSTQLDGIGQDYLPNNGAQLSNAMNRYESVGGAALSYDARGNTLNDGAGDYEYDLLNRMTAASGSGGDATYVYDALGRRLAKIVGVETTIFIYDSRGQVLEERSGTDQLLARYTYGAALDEPVAFERDGLTYYYHRDALGSVTEVSDAAGALVERYEYQVYGQVTIFDPSGAELPASSIGNPYLFTSQRFDPESGNYYFRARFYSPALGRFLQMDPTGFSDGVNLYQYARNQPTLLTDPTGLFAVKAGLSVKFVLAAGPLPWPGTYWRIRVFIDGAFFKCCNQQSGLTEVWYEAKFGISLDVVFGKTVGKKLEKFKPDSDKFKFGKRSDSTDLSMFDQVGPCPEKGCKGFIEGFIEGKGGFGAGIKISVKFPIYPQFLPPPKVEVTQYTGIVGIEIAAGVKGGGKCIGRVGDIFDVF